MLANLVNFGKINLDSQNVVISLLFISQKAVKAQIIGKILNKMLPRSEKNSFIDFLREGFKSKKQKMVGFIQRSSDPSNPGRALD